MAKRRTQRQVQAPVSQTRAQPPSQPQQPTHFVITGQLAQAIANYLVTKPYQEVMPLIEELKKLRPVNVQQAQVPAVDPATLAKANGGDEAREGR